MLWGAAGKVKTSVDARVHVCVHACALTHCSYVIVQMEETAPAVFPNAMGCYL